MSHHLFVVSAPSGAGKTSLVRALLEQLSDCGVAVSHTTRARRREETDGINYHFTDEPTFRQMIKKGAFLEWANVFGNLYGTSIEAATLVLESGKHLILEIDWQGAEQIRQAMPEARSVFIFPPSTAALKERLENRAQDDEATVQKRLNAAVEEMSQFRKFDYLIVNDDFDVALSELQRIVTGQGEDLTVEDRLPELKSLIADLLPQNLP